MGRKKIEIKKINCPIKRRETFRKRSKGILKKIKELAILCEIEVDVKMFSPTGKCEHFSNGPRTEQMLQQVHQNYISNLPEEEMTNLFLPLSLQVPENVHMPMPIQHLQGGNEAGEVADYKEELKFGRSDQSHLLKSENPYLSSQQIGNGQFYRTSSTNPSSGFKLNTSLHMQNAHWHLSMQQPQMWAAPQDRGEVLMNTDPSSIQASMLGHFQPEVKGPYGASVHMWGPLVGGLEMPFSNGVQPSSSLWRLPEGVVGSNEDPMQATTKHEVSRRI